MIWFFFVCGIILGKYGNGVFESFRVLLKVFFFIFRKESGRERGWEAGRKIKGNSFVVVCGFGFSRVWSWFCFGRCFLVGF